MSWDGAPPPPPPRDPGSRCCFPRKRLNSRNQGRGPGQVGTGSERLQGAWILDSALRVHSRPLPRGFVVSSTREVLEVFASFDLTACASVSWAAGEYALAAALEHGTCGPNLEPSPHDPQQTLQNTDTHRPVSQKPVSDARSRGAVGMRHTASQPRAVGRCRQRARPRLSF